MLQEEHHLLRDLHWLGHSSFRIGDAESDGPVIYIDPWRLQDDEPPADIVLVSHDRYDHCSPDDIARIRTPDTVIVANETSASVIGEGVIVLRAWQSAPAIDGFTVRAVPAYSLDKGVNTRTGDGLGFIITFPDHHSLYFAGDTDLIPEMAHIKCDVALLPVDGTFNMTVEEAAQAARQLKPQHAIPMHFGSGVAGTRFDGSRFCELVKPPVEAVLLPNEGREVPTTGALS